MTLAIGLPVLSLAALGFAERDRLVHRIGTVREGVLYRSATLSPDRLEAFVREHGIRTLVNLRHSDLEAERAIAERHGARYVQIPCGQVPDLEQIDRFLEILDDPANQPVLVHCMHGVGRTGVFSAVYRIEQDGWTAEQAIEEASNYAVGGSFHPGQDKTEFLLGYVPRRARAGTPQPTAP